MTSALVAALTEAIRDVAAVVGPGWPDGSGPAAALGAFRDQLRTATGDTTGAWRGVESGWSGIAADAAREFGDTTAVAIEAMMARTEELGAASERASAAVARARSRLEAVLEEFEARAATLDGPGTEHVVIAEGRRALAEAIRIVEDLRAELDQYADAVRPPPAAPSPAATTPAGASGLAPPATMPAGAGFGGAPAGAGLSSPLGSSGMGAWGAVPLGAGGLGRGPEGRRTAQPLTDPATFGKGETITLPDGSTVTAPNAVAAEAVRRALTQLGVPYDWGGTTPGVGLDCSGLTQWAYGEAGLDLPRLAQEQDVGAAVGSSSLRPGDLAVWDGHVAMVVGNGLMIEAGDPVKLSPVRTSNAGQGFQGFWRPTA